MVPVRSSRPVTRSGGGEPGGVVARGGRAGAAILAALGCLPACTVFDGLEPTDPYALAVLDDAPMAYYRFDEGEGSVARDFTGHGHDGVYEGAQFTDGGAVSGNRALALDGDAGVDLGDDTAFAFAGRAPFSLEAWMRTSTREFQILIDRSERVPSETAGVDDRLGYHLSFRKDPSSPEQDEIVVERLHGHESGEFCTLNPPNTDDAWRDRLIHVVATFDGEALQLYLDGIATGPVRSCPVDLDGERRTLRIGSKPEGIEGFEGVVDEVAIYDRALSPVRIRAHFEAASPP